MTIQSLAGKKICILGFGKEGRAMATALETYAPGCSITIADKNAALQIDHPHYRYQLGDRWLENLDAFDVVITSPGIFPSQLLGATYKLLTSPTQIFFDSIATSGARVIGVTGSKGKSTTSSLIHHILSAPAFVRSVRTSSGRHSSQPKADCLLIGNIGEPTIAHIGDAKPGVTFVLELSSYQLMHLTVSPHIAVVTSFFPEHLDYHGSLDAYLEAKKHIARFQEVSDHIYYNAKNAQCKEIAEESAGFKHPFSDLDAPLEIEATQLKGNHNRSNIAAAFLVCEQLGVPHEVIVDAIKSFAPLPHRLQSLGMHHGVEWIDDSISTTPESAIAALDALGSCVHTIILGGQDRGYDFAPLVEKLKESRVTTVILLPDSGEKIGRMINAAARNLTCFQVKNMNEAVQRAINQTQEIPEATGLKAPIILLSPASPSYGHFKNFEERGDAFKQAILRHPPSPSRGG